MKKMKKSFTFILVLCVLLSLLVVPGLAAPRNLRLSHSAFEGHPTWASCETLKKEIEARTNGAITVEIYPSSMLGNTTDVVEQIKLGVVDMGIYTNGQLSAYDSSFGILNFPYFFDDHRHVFACLDGKPGDMLKAKALEAGFKVLYFWDNGFRQVTNSVRPLNSPADFVGLRLRVPPEITLETAMRTLGATPTTIAFTELYMAMLQGVCDGQENPLATIYNDKFYEAQKYVAMMNYSYHTNHILFNPGVWNSFSPEIQKAIMEAGEVATKFNRQLVMDNEKQYIEDLIKNGMEFSYPDPAVMRETLMPARQELSKTVNAAWYEEFAAAVEGVRQSLK